MPMNVGLALLWSLAALLAVPEAIMAWAMGQHLGGVVFSLAALVAFWQAARWMDR